MDSDESSSSATVNDGVSKPMDCSSLSTSQSMPPVIHSTSGRSIDLDLLYLSEAVSPTPVQDDENSGNPLQPRFLEDRLAQIEKFEEAVPLERATWTLNKERL